MSDTTEAIEHECMHSSTELLLNGVLLPHPSLSLTDSQWVIRNRIDLYNSFCFYSLFFVFFFNIASSGMSI